MNLMPFLNFCRSQSIFSAVAFYMKHLGVKTRAVDSKKSKGGFFRRQLVKVNYPNVCNWKASLFYKTFNCICIFVALRVVLILY